MVAGTAPALVEGTASIEPAGNAEEAMTAKHDALVPREQGVVTKSGGCRDKASASTRRRQQRENGPKESVEVA